VRRRTSRRIDADRPGGSGFRCGVPVALAAVVLIVSTALAQDLPLGEVVAAMRGYGLTEAADGVRRFEVEVLDLQRPTGPGWATILIRSSGSFLDDVGGLAAGMSGSPVYLGPVGAERLAGALAFAFPASEHRLALVTPIAAMRALQAGDHAPATPPSGGAPLAAPLLRAGTTDLALHRADVSVIVANRDLPYKLANLAAEPFGTVVRDGQAGRLARSDQVPGGLPVIVRVETDGAALTVATRVARDPALTPALSWGELLAALERVTVRVEVTAEPSDGAAGEESP